MDTIDSSETEGIQRHLPRRHLDPAEGFHEAIDAQPAWTVGLSRSERPWRNPGVPTMGNPLHSDPLFAWFALPLPQALER